jgi:ubiquinone/menaquinone biosynthesis C-methylase UbiE
MPDIRECSGRGTDQALTEFISWRILAELAIAKHDRLVDIGCGDGTLLRFALQCGVRDAIGLNGTEEEARLVRASGLDVRQALTDSLPLPDQCASVIVCNSVLHIVPAEKIPASLREIARIAAPEARIWIGEIPRFREPASLREFSSVPAMLWWLLRKRGIRTFLGMCRRLVTGAQRGPMLATSQAFWAEPDQFSRMASDAGLSVERQFPHETLDGKHQPCLSATRHDYVLRPGPVSGRK